MLCAARDSITAPAGEDAALKWEVELLCSLVAN